MFMYKGTATNWAVVPMYDDGTNGDEYENDHIWTAVIENIPAGEHQWGAISTDNGDGSVCLNCDGSDGWGTWLIDGDNPEYLLEEDLTTYRGITEYLHGYGLGTYGTKTIVFSVDMTEWINENESGMKVFNPSYGDELQVRGSFNNWGNCSDCIMERITGTNIYTLSTEVTDYESEVFDFTYYIDFSDSSIFEMEQRFNSFDIVNWIGWESSPVNLGNRSFSLDNSGDSSDVIELPLDYFYDAFPGSVIPEGRKLNYIIN